MRIDDVLYFAPGIKFKDVDLKSADLPGLFECRIGGFYLDPADCCSDKGFAFAAGVILVSCIDALARVSIGGKSGVRFKNFVKKELPSFSVENIATRFYEDFRNGLVHEARVKNGGQFTMEINQAVQSLGDVLLVNPKLLSGEIRLALGRYIVLLRENTSARKRFADKLSKDFETELKAAGS